MSAVRVRFAPSPTGELHVGGLRTALFNYLFAKKNGGQFILRIEDTDQERHVEGTEQGIIEILEWAGIPPDEGPHIGGPYGPYRQSERLAKYREAVDTLIARGNAYKCYCSPEELDEMRKGQQARGLPPKYDGRHRNLTEEQRERFEAEGRKPVVRMRIPDRDERIVVNDAIRGNVAFNSSQLDDQVLLKSDGFPTYHLAVVVDDNAMEISHILRAEEWLPSTPKHLLLYRWLEFAEPVFAHLPLLLNDDRSKMSKRKGDVAAGDYRRKGYLSDALVNFLALLGWSPGDDREILTRRELLDLFSIERIGKAGAVFDRNKLNWMNEHYIRALPPGQLYELLRPYIAKSRFVGENEQTLRKIAMTVQSAMVTLADIEGQMGIFFRQNEDPVAPEVPETIKEGREVLEALREQLEARESLTQETFREVTKAVQKETGLKGKALFAPMRAALTLEREGPDLAQIVEVFGKEKTLNRLEHSLSAF